MAIPVIDNRTSVLGYPLGLPWSYCPRATNAPVLWKWEGLPPGMAADDVSVFWNCTGSNGDSDFEIASLPFNDGDAVAFYSKTGGSSIVLYKKYFVRDKYNNLFKLSETAGGAAISLGSDVTSAQLCRVNSGRITGAAMSVGVYLSEVTAYNANGSSETLVVPIGIYNADYNETGSLRVNVDVQTGKVWPAGVAEWKEGTPVAFVKNGDTLVVDVGFTSDGGETLLPLLVNKLSFGLKEDGTEPLLFQTDGNFDVVGDASLTRFRMLVPFPVGLSSVLSNYEDEKGTCFDALAEIEWKQHVEYVVNEVPDGGAEMPLVTRSSVTFPVRLAMEIVK